jgi:multidrug efflux pump subunit AcrB
MPVKRVNGAIIYVRDVATGAGRISLRSKTLCGATACAARLLTIMKGGAASTLDVVKGIKEALEPLKTTIPARH